MDAETFKKVFVPYHEKLYHIALRMTEDSGNAKDLVQETYVKLWNRKEDLKKLENPEGFAVVVLRNICVDFLRKTRKNFLQTDDIDIPEQTSLFRQIELNDQINHVTRLIEQLPEPQRTLMKLKHWNELSDQEIEIITGLSLINIRVILSRTRAKIREQFEILNLK